MKCENNLMNLAERLFPICRSITGDGVRQTLSILKEYIPELKIFEVPSGTKVFDWVVPKEWKISEAYIETLDGTRILDFKENNLHVVGYSIPINKIVSRDELLSILYTQKDQPNAVPYVTSYYKERYGFCCTECFKESLADDYYHIVIKSELFEGYLNYAEVILPGYENKEVMFSTYICHPSMANNEISGPIVNTFLIEYLRNLPNRRFTYRFIFIPETIGSIVYLKKNLEYLQKHLIAGFNITCVGDTRCYSYVSSPYGCNLADKVAQNVLHYHASDYKKYSFLERGSDERQYCSPLVHLPFCCLCRSKFGDYPEYHTSLDNLELISEEGMQGSLLLLKKIVNALEYNFNYKIKVACEPQLGIRGLYPTISQKGASYDKVKSITNFIAYSDGTNDLIDISNLINVSTEELVEIVNKLDSLLVKM